MYPRKGVPLLPAVLVPIIGDRYVRALITRRYGLPDGLRLRDLDAGVWDRFPHESIPQLAGDVLLATRQAFPEIAASPELAPIDPSGEGLSTQSRNALFRAGLFGASKLRKAPLGFLAQEHGVGGKTLLEWLVAGEARDLAGEQQKSESDRDHRAGCGTRSRAVREAADAVRRRRWSEHLRATDPRLGGRVTALRSEAATAREAAERLMADLFEPGAARRKALQLRQFLADAERFRRVPLGDEMDQLLAAMLDSAGRRAVKMRLGLGGEPPVTLEQAGRAVGLTRERVRQLEGRFADAVRSSAAWTPVLEKVLTTLARAAPIRSGDAQDLLLDKGLVQSPFSIESILSASRLYGLDAGFSFDHEADVIYNPDSSVSPKLIASKARRLTTHWGATTIDALRAELAEGGASEVDPAVLRVLVESVPNVQWLDEEMDWFWIKGTRRNRLLNQAEKIMAVAGSIDIAELREGVGRHHRMDGFRPPRHVLARLCEEAGLCYRDGDLMIEGPDVPPWEDVLGSTIEGRMAEVLFEHGPVMRRDDLARIVVDELGVNRSSFYVYLGYAPIIARYAAGVYGLRGARVTAAEVDALIPPRAWTQRLVDHGWTTDGRVWLGYKMSSATLTAGVLSVPAALRDYVAGSYLLFSDQDRPVGTLAVKEGHMWGVSPFFRRWGIEEGDFVVVTIDINGSKATIAAGGEELLLRYQKAE